LVAFSAREEIETLAGSWIERLSSTAKARRHGLIAR
jgi:hypothetical protein